MLNVPQGDFQNDKSLSKLTRLSISIRSIPIGSVEDFDGN